MDTINLPEAFHLDSTLPVQVFDYQNSQAISKQQIVLNKHTISFLMDGSKEVLFDNSQFSIFYQYLITT
ncbi:hypothetical protein [Aureivirga sp. CE67]|uniref:hypothetical protein n=1 Tax=Aureivirga sp. CE67 TaxID=1788983 RepID=UPI0018C9CADA|nr:hypothetical protein [Aureivirga sp. CE67]